MFRWMASAAACFSDSSAGKSGKPCARLMAPCSMARRVISRMTDSVKLAVRWLRKRVRKAGTEDDIVRDYVKPRGSVKWGFREGPAGVAAGGPLASRKERYAHPSIHFPAPTR